MRSVKSPVVVKNCHIIEKFKGLFGRNHTAPCLLCELFIYDLIILHRLCLFGTLLYQTELNRVKKEHKLWKLTIFLVFSLIRKDVISILIMWSDCNKQWLKNICASEKFVYKLCKLNRKVRVLCKRCSIPPTERSVFFDFLLLLLEVLDFRPGIFLFIYWKLVYVDRLFKFIHMLLTLDYRLWGCANNLLDTTSELL